MGEYIGLDVSLKETAISVRRDGKRTYYRLQDEHIRTLVDMGMSHAAEEGRTRAAVRLTRAARRGAR